MGTVASFANASAGETSVPVHHEVVSNGLYTLTGPINVLKAITLRGQHGAAGATVDANHGSRAFVISNAAAVVDGFTITRA